MPIVDFELDDQQRLVLDALADTVGEARSAPIACRESFLWDPALEERLEEGGFFALCANGYSLLEAALVAFELGRLAPCVEAAASLLVLPILPKGWARPIALHSGLANRPIRFLPVARTVLLEQDGKLTAIELRPGDVEPCTTRLGYPYGRLSHAARERGQPVEVDREVYSARVRLALAVALTSALDGALAQTLQYVKDRRLFGRTLGAFQAVQHRLAADAQRVESARLLALHAAARDGGAHAAVAAAYAQHVSQDIVFDCHQFCGAMGLTLEYPLHLWTYRARALQGECGGAAFHAQQASRLTWEHMEQ
jgi:hypothetical protein